MLNFRDSFEPVILLIKLPLLEMVCEIITHVKFEYNRAFVKYIVAGIQSKLIY